ncbi:poly ADP-ribose polymerase 12-like, partial [Arapaima gigas]
CQHYNKGNCKYGSKCRDLHICKYFFRGECRYGSSCRLSHVKVSGSESSSDEERSGKQRQRRRRRRSTDSRFEGPFRWQINDGSGWKDIANDHIIEAQYSKPTTKGMTIYNTRFGAISIDFKKMKVQKKHSLRVRRQSSAEVTWVWYYSGNHGWVQFGETVS